MENKFENRKCALCGKEYSPLTKNQRYCGYLCRNAAHRIKVNNKSKVNANTNITNCKKSEVVVKNSKSREVVQDFTIGSFDIKIIKFVNLFYWKAFKGDIIIESEYFDFLSDCVKDSKKAFK